MPLREKKPRRKVASATAWSTSFALHAAVFFAFFFSTPHLGVPHGGRNSYVEMREPIVGQVRQVTRKRKAWVVPAKSQNRMKEKLVEPPFEQAPIGSQNLEVAGGGAISGDGSISASRDLLKQSFIDELRFAIEREKEYPAIAKARRQTGQVLVGFTLLKMGEITNVRVIKSSNYALLDDAAVSTLRRLGKFKPVPDEVSEGDWALSVPLDYRLQGGGERSATGE